MRMHLIWVMEYMSMKLFREAFTLAKKKNDLRSITESAIPSCNLDETVFVAKSINKYLIVFIDIVSSTQKLEKMNMSLEEITSFFGDFNMNAIRNFRELVSNDFKFKMMGDGLLFFVPIKTTAGKLLTSNGTYYQDKCEKLHNQLNNHFDIRTVAGYGKLIEFDVGLDTGWTDYYGIAINNIVHASKELKGEFKWV